MGTFYFILRIYYEILIKVGNKNIVEILDNIYNVII